MQTIYYSKAPDQLPSMESQPSPNSVIHIYMNCATRHLTIELLNAARSFLKMFLYIFVKTKRLLVRHLGKNG